MARARQRLRHEAQLGRRPAQTMDQQHAKAAAGEKQAAIWEQVFVLSVHLFTRTEWMPTPTPPRPYTPGAHCTNANNRRTR